LCSKVKGNAKGSGKKLSFGLEKWESPARTSKQKKNTMASSCQKNITGKKKGLSFKRKPEKNQSTLGQVQRKNNIGTTIKNTTKTKRRSEKSLENPLPAKNNFKSIRSRGKKKKPTLRKKWKGGKKRT